MKVWCFIIVFFLLLPSNSKLTETSLKFDIVLRNKVVGQLVATEINKDTKVFYHSSTNIKTRIITEIHVNYKYDVVYDNATLKKADVYVSVNDKLHAETHTEWMNDQYLIKEDKKKVTHDEPINYSTILLYFKEPKHVKECFSEEDGSLNTIVSLGNHVYKKINSKGKENIYYYQKGKLTKAEIDGGIVDFQIIAK